MIAIKQLFKGSYPVARDLWRVYNSWLNIVKHYVVLDLSLFVS